jgi:copper resistance protein C
MRTMKEELLTGISPLTRHFFRNALLLMAVLSVAGMHLEGHAILKSSSPAHGGSVISPDVPVKLTFNVRVDAARSKLQLLMPDASTVELPIVGWPSPDTLVSKLTGLKPGAYAIRWQVLAPDGHISRGEIPFTVRNP